MACVIAIRQRRTPAAHAPHAHDTLKVAFQRSCKMHGFTGEKDHTLREEPRLSRITFGNADGLASHQRPTRRMPAWTITHWPACAPATSTVDASLLGDEPHLLQAARYRGAHERVGLLDVVGLDVHLYVLHAASPRANGRGAVTRHEEGPRRDGEGLKRWRVLEPAISCEAAHSPSASLRLASHSA